MSEQLSVEHRSPEAPTGLPPLNEALRKLIGDHLRKFLGMRGAYIKVIGKPAKPNTNKRVEGWIAEPVKDPARHAAYLNPPNPFSKEKRYTVKTEDSGNNDPTIPTAGGEEDVQRWIDKFIRQMEDTILFPEMGALFVDKEIKHPLLMAFYHVLREALRKEGEASRVLRISHGVCMNLARELDDIFYRDVETGYMAEGDTLLEGGLTLGEDYGLVVDERRPRIVTGENARGAKDGKVLQMGYKYNPVTLGLALSALVRAAIIAEIESKKPEVIAEAKRCNPGLWNPNKGKQTLRHGWNNEYELETSYDWTRFL